nr:HNH endonuclease [Tenacibaculum dicentrarchi]
MITRNFYNEKWKYIKFDENISDNELFKISNYGRIINCTNSEEFIVKEYFINGYQNLPLKQKKNGKRTSRYVHKLVAEHFLENKNNGVCVIHLNYDKTDNHISNLRWATKREKEIHQFSNPKYVNFVRETPYNSKLTETKVMRLKKRIFSKKRNSSFKKIAKEFGISEMQLHRIKKGENWAYVN